MKALPSTGNKTNQVMLGSAALILLAIVGLSYVEWRQYSRAVNEFATSQEITESVERLLAGLLDAETAQRGFLLTGEIQYLDPYTRAVRTVPGELANLEKLLALRPREAATSRRVDALVKQRMAELRQTIDLRRTQGVQPALDVVLGGQGQRTMNDLRGVCLDIRSRSNLAQNEASRRGEAAAQIALLVTTVGALILLFFFVAGVEPLMGGEPRAKQRPYYRIYGVVVLVTVAATLLRVALIPVLGHSGVAFILYFPAVLISAWYGGLRPAMLTILFSAMIGGYYFAEPVRTFVISNPVDQIHLLLFIIVGFGMALLSHSQRRALERADREAARRGDAENAEREQRQRLETTLTSIGDAVISTDAEGRVLFANPVALSLLRCSGPDVTSNHLDAVFRIVNEFSRAELESPVTKVMREGTMVGLANHTVLVARDGTEIPIDDSAAPIRDSSGTLLGTVMVFRDVTARRRAEGISRLLGSIVESSNDSIISTDLRGIVTSWNKASERIFGYSTAEMIGQPEALLHTPGAADDPTRILERLEHGERTEHYQTVRRTKQGELINVSISASPLRDAAERIVGVSKIARDITEQVHSAARLAELNADLQKSNKRLARLNKDLESFAFVASHDLQEPLRMITAYAQLLVKTYSGQLDKDASLYVDNIVEGSRRMRDLLRDLLAYMEVGGPAEEPLEAVDLNHALEAVRQNLKLSIEESGTVITCDLLPTVSAHQNHLVPLFQNLIGNAIKYQANAPPQIRISAMDRGDHWRFAVVDNGIGIRPEHHSKIFEAFKRLHGSEIRGTGMGLAICQRVVERYGGRIWVESQLDQGATFLFTLPKIGSSPQEA